jgi:hypothetical protein
MNRKMPERVLVHSLDVFGVGIPACSAGVLLVAGIARDPLIVVGALLLFVTYLVGYITGRVLHTSLIPTLLAAVVLIGGGLVLFVVSRDATWLVYVISPSVGLVVSSSIASRGRN